MFIRKFEDFSSFDGFKWLSQVLVNLIIDYHPQYIIANDTIKTHHSNSNKIMMSECDSFWNVF